MQNNELVSSLLLASQYEFLRAFIVGSTMSSLNIIFVNSLMLCVLTSSMWLPLCLHFISYSLIRAEQRAFCNFFLWLWLTATTVDHKTKQVSVCLAATEDSSKTDGCTRTGRHDKHTHFILVTGKCYTPRTLGTKTVYATLLENCDDNDDDGALYCIYAGV